MENVSQRFAREILGEVLLLEDTAAIHKYLTSTFEKAGIPISEDQAVKTESSLQSLNTIEEKIIYLCGLKS